jgi:hypothetical protein
MQSQALHKFLSFRHKRKEFVMDTAPDLLALPLPKLEIRRTARGLTKAFAAECAFGSMQTEFHEAKTVPGILRVAQGITLRSAGFFSLLDLFPCMVIRRNLIICINVGFLTTCLIFVGQAH